MDVILNPGKWYRRYRYENQYDAPFLIFMIDLSIGFVKLLLLAFLAIAAWVAYTKYQQMEGTASNKSANTVVVSTAAMKSTSDSGVATNNEAARQTATGAENVQQTGTSGQQIAASASPTTPNQANAILADSEWLATLSPNEFILQFASSDSLDLIDELVPVIDTGAPIAIYPFKRTRSGTPVYGIATGVYPDVDSALAAIESLPQQARTYNPWIRSVEELNLQIQTMRTGSN